MSQRDQVREAERHRGFLDALPPVELARSWGLKVQVIDRSHAAGFLRCS